MARDQIAFVAGLAGMLLVPPSSAQLIQENTTVQLEGHTYAIPDPGVIGVPMSAWNQN